VGIGFYLCAKKTVDIKRMPSPAFILEASKLRANLQLIDRVQKTAGVKIILAFKGFAMWSAFPLVRQYLSGATASSLHEARLCAEAMQSPAHTYAVAYSPREFGKILSYSGHLTFNSLSQLRRFGKRVAAYPKKISIGLRVNPEWSPVDTDLYNPAAPGSRLGEPAENLGSGLPPIVEGLHFHVLCESSSYDLEHTLVHFEQKFGHLLPNLRWVNFGGGHLMTKPGYDVEHLIRVLQDFKIRHPHLEVILEPGSAVAWDAGILVATVLDIVKNKQIKTAILDVSFTAHMPDTLEMPYRPRIRGARDPQRGDKHVYRLGGVSCLSGDYMEAYAFESPLKVGQKIVLEDMMHYTMVKTTTFNGVTHPSIAIWTEGESLEIVRKFNYKDYRNRLS
jgi:carboxynorspermidine decarboxylase